MAAPFSPGLFGLRAPDPTASLASFTPQFDGNALAAPTPVLDPAGPAAAPFIWGGAGERLTNDDIDARQKRDEQQIAAGMDFSPIGSWSQGAARVAQALAGAWDEKRLDKASAANVAANNQAIASLSQPGGTNEQNIAALLTDDTLSEGVHQYAKMKLAGMTKAPPKPDTHAGQLIDEGLTPGTPTFQARMNAFNTQQEMGTPFVYEQWNPVTRANDKVITTRSAIAGSTSAAAPEAPPAEAIAYLQQNPGMASHFDEKYGPGASQHYLAAGGAVPGGPRTFPVR